MNPAATAGLLLLFILQAHAEKVTFRLVAREGDALVPVSKLCDTWQATGGLVAVEWTGGVQVGDVPVFTRIPVALEEGAKEKDEFLEQVGGGETAGERRRPLADDLYVGKDVGPQYLRPSVREVELAGREFLLTPGDIPFRLENGVVKTADPRARVTDDGGLEIECVALTLTAVRPGGDPTHRPFRVSLTFGARNLLDDVLLEPDEFYLGPSVEASKADFVRLTVYLIPNRQGAIRSAEYRLQDVPFHLDARGVELARQDGPVRQAGPHHVVLEAPPLVTERPDREMFLFAVGPAGYHQILVRTNPGAVWFQERIPLPAEDNPRRTLYFVARAACPEMIGGPWHGDTSFSMPADFQRFPCRIAVVENRRAGLELPAVYVFSHHWRAPDRRLRVRVVGVRGKEDVLAGRSFIPARLRRGYFDGERSWSGEAISLTPGAEPGLWEAMAPDGFDGLTALTFPEFLDPALWVELPFLLGPENLAGSVSLLTPNNRVHFQVGETIEIHAVARFTQPMDERVTLTLDHGNESLEGPSVNFRTEGGPATRTFSLSTPSLKPGIYRIAGRASRLMVHPVGFELFSDVRPTDYPSVALKPFSHETPDCRIGYLRFLMGADPNGALGHLMPEEAQVFERSGRLPPSFGRMLDSDPLLPVSERAVGTNALSRMLALGISQGALYFWEPSEGYVQYNIQHTTDIDNARMYRLQQMYVQQARGIASFGGLANFWHAPLYGYWEGSPAVDGHQPRRNRQVAEDFTRASGMAVPTAEEQASLRTRKGEEAARDDIRRRLLAWRYWEASTLPKAFKLWHAAMDEIQGEFPNRLWLLNRPPSPWATGVNSYPPTFFGPLDAVTTYNITDFGRMPFDLPFGAAISAAGVDRRLKLIHAWTWSRGSALVEGLLAMAHGADGVDPSGNELVSHNIPGLLSTYDRRQVMEIFSRYGNWMRRLERVKDVAILYSVRQAWGEADASHASRLRSLFYDLLRSRRSVTILLDEDLTQNRIEGFRALFLLGMTCPWPEEDRRRLKEFEETGGVIFKDEDSTEGCPGRCVTLWKQAAPGYPPGDGEFEFAKVWQDYLKRRPALEEALAAVPAPWASTDSPRRLLSLKEGRKLRFAAVLNDELVPLEVEGRYRQDHVLPARGAVEFDKEYVIYDLLEGGEAKKTRSLPLEFARCEARLLALTPAPLQSLVVRGHEVTLRPGQPLLLFVEVRDAAGETLTDPIPLEITVTSPSGAPRWRLHRTRAPTDGIDLSTAANDEAGEWNVRVRELISGLTSVASFTLADRTRPPHVLYEKERVLRFDGQALDRFFRRPGRVQLLLEPGQSGLLDRAKAIAAACEVAGRPARLRVVQPDEIRMVPLRWERTRRDQEVWAALGSGELIGLRQGLRTTVDPRQKVDFVRPDSGYRDPGPQHLILEDVILMGKPGENRFLDEAQSLSPRQVTGHYPGPGRALLQHVWSPFWARCHAVTLSAGDDAGLDAGSDHLLQVIQESGQRHDGQDAEPPGIGVGEVQAPRGSAASGEREPLPRLVGERMGSPVVSMSVSPDGQFIGVAARLYGSNLFLLDPGGRVLWKEHLGLHGPSEVLVTAGAAQTYATVGEELLVLDRTGRGRARLGLPSPGVGAAAWSAGPTTVLIDPRSEDLFISGYRRIQRAGPGGETRWHYSDLPWCQEALDFYYGRGAFLKALSPDGRRVLASLFGIVQGQLGYLASYWKPGLVMLDAQTGELLWRYQGLVVNNALAAISGDRAVVYDDDGGLHVFDGQGRRIQSLVLALGLERMELTSDGRALVLRTAMARDAIRKAYGRSMHLMRIDLESGRTERYATEGEISDFALSSKGDLVAASSWAGKLYLFRLAGEKAWERDLPGGGGALLRFLPSSNLLIAGTATGKVLGVDLAGNERWRLDLMLHNYPGEQFVREVQDDREYPERKIKPPAAALESVFERAKAFADFEFLPAGPALEGRLSLLDQAMETPGFECPALSTFIVSFRVCAEGNWEACPYDRVRVEAVSGDRTIYSASMPLAAAWSERLVSFKTGPRSARIAMRLTPERYRPFTVGLVASAGEKTEKVKPITPFGVDGFQWARVRYRSPNWLRARTEEDLLRGAPPGGAASGEVQAKIEIPNPYPHVYEVGFIKPRLSEVTFLDGQISGQETSWARGNSIETGGVMMEGAGHPFRYASLQVTLPRPRLVSAVAVYEDPSGPVALEKAWQGSLLREKTARSYAVLVRDAETQKWRPFACVQENVNVFNLLVGQPVRVDALQYFWTGSGDWHIRLAEIEAYGPAGETEDDLESTDEETTEEAEGDGAGGIGGE
ncbi:MAG: PQQ-binding-like beta-propeller repeat protein [Planctomycetes bacterium]|nr:PQQ-binding-like beta-propeller repeat protein [Planctomycetota bacterium]